MIYYVYQITMTMKKSVYITLLMFFILMLANDGICQDKPNLYNLYRKKAETKVYILPIENLSNGNKSDAKCLSRELKDALRKRKSVKFSIVKKREDSDITIGCELKSFYWSEDDPIDMIFGTYAIAYDLVTNENYAFQDVIFTVTHTKKNRVLWKERLKIDLTKADMTEEQSIPLINKKTVKTFIRDCFSKNHIRGR